MKTETQRINNIVGQLEGIKKMVDEDKDCFEVLTQIKAVRSALRSFSSQYLSSRFSTCMSACKKDQSDEVCAKFMSELLDETL
ncbi:metal-sensitive transcriptional regulator [Patescibacteria group bacterium]|nr:metal-sensitive transcriptional regulator [Patescibacteria group bacterium]MBU4453164.1 metal-sensitive transcriptional regulator [Patescibacteria group bacterium]MCG2687587.1 metal-sensitive transcriptional regulator [Candidatus Parcubacteria bacterium]